jgi:hypothetical protein
MGRIVIVVAPGAGFGPGAVAAAWNADVETSAAGTAKVEAAGCEVFFPGLVELVVVPLAVNVASSVAYDLIKKLAGRLRRDGGGEPQVERPEVTAGGGDVIIVIRGGDGPR